jgi:hypothetical protein
MKKAVVFLVLFTLAHFAATWCVMMMGVSMGFGLLLSALTPGPAQRPSAAYTATFNVLFYVFGSPLLWPYLRFAETADAVEWNDKLTPFMPPLNSFVCALLILPLWLRWRRRRRAGVDRR